MPPTFQPHWRRATTSVLAVVALMSGSVVLLGDRFDAMPGHALSQPAHVEAPAGACVAPR